MTKLLFVDDDENLLRAMQQRLRSQRRAWEMRFATSGEEALAMLDDFACDAVITDMRMPKRDGSDVLKRVRQQYPSALRIVLSGQMNEAAAARSASLAHRFLAKPIETELLVSILKRSVELREQFQSDAMRRCIGGLATLPSLPAACAALDRALGDEQVSTRDVHRIIESDGAMSTKVLQLVNSAFFGLAREVVSTEQAIRLLGLNAVRSLAMANALFEQLAGNDMARLEAEQARSLRVTRYVRRFTLPQRQAEVAATAAMLHNVGGLALIARLPAEYQANHELAEREGLSVLQAERSRMGVTSAEIGAYLLSLWGLPLEVIETVALEEAPSPLEQTLDAAAAVWLAKRLGDEAARLGLAQDPLVDDVAGRLGVGAVVESIRDEIASDQFGRRAS